MIKPLSTKPEQQNKRRILQVWFDGYPEGSFYSGRAASVNAYMYVLGDVPSEAVRLAVEAYVNGRFNNVADPSFCPSATMLRKLAEKFSEASMAFEGKKLDRTLSRLRSLAIDELPTHDEVQKHWVEFDQANAALLAAAKASDCDGDAP